MANPSVLVLVTGWMYLRCARCANSKGEMWKSPWPADSRSLSGMVGCAGHVDVMLGRDALKKLVLHNFCMISSHSVFHALFLRWLEIPRGSIYEAIYLYGGWCLLITSHLWMASPSGQADGSGSKIWNSLFLASWTLTLKVWIHRRLSFWIHTIHLFAISNSQYLPPTKEAFETTSSKYCNAKFSIKVFSFKT